jgi:Family of unknown function (DUF6065)
MTTFSFFGCFDGVSEPRPADPRLFGSPPFRAVTYCEPFRAATGYGWYTYPPLDCFLKWDGASFSFLAAGGTSWLPVNNVPAAVIYRMRDEEPPPASAMDLPIFSELPEPGMLQVWTGLMARTDPGWNLLVRSIPNLPASLAFEVLEGIIETDWWHGPLLGNLRFRKTEEVIRLETRRPLMAIQPVRREAFQAGLLRDTEFLPYGSAQTVAAEVMMGDALKVRKEGQPGGYRAQVSRSRRKTDEEI